ncbi:MAG: FHA domain-containing protein [Pseudomonadota bacterium]
MKQLKDVIVRKRPLSFSGPGGRDRQAEPVADFGPIAAARSEKVDASDKTGSPDTGHPVAEVPEDPRISQASAKQIWDIEPCGQDQPEPETPQDTQDEPAKPLVRARLRPDAPADPDASPARVKTRILGLHSDDLAEDVFDGQAVDRSASSLFPAGWVVIVEGPGRGMSFAIAAGVSTIGRAQDQTICLDFGDQSISRQNHASLAYDEEQNAFFIGHGGKSNIVRRNGNPILSTEALTNTDLIRIGKTTLRFVALCGPDFMWTTPEQGDEGDDGVN